MTNVCTLCMYKEMFFKNTPLERIDLEDIFLDISMTESRKTPIPGAASTRFSICRNYGRTNAQHIVIQVSLDTANYI